MPHEQRYRFSTDSTVYYLGSFRFPDGDAAAARVLGTGRALREGGANVVFAGWEKEGRQQDLQPDGSFRFDDFTYVSQADLRYTYLSPPRRLEKVLLAGRNTLRWFARQPIRPGDVVVAYHGGGYFLSRLRRLCEDRNLRLAIDCTEWYSPRQIPGGRFSPAWWSEEITMRFINPSVGRLMVISSYLEQYYASRGCAVLRVPPLIDLQDPRWATSARTAPAFPPLRLAYAGTPGRKDLLTNVLRGLVALRGQNQPIILNLIGPTRASLIEAAPECARWLTQLGEHVVFHGYVPQSDVPRRLTESHFTVLLRPDQRYARAGFPTKVVESLGAGVPVITNPTSDLSQFIQDEREGILIDDDSPESLASGIRRVIALGTAAWRNMGVAARQRAESTFDYRAYIEPIRHFIFESDHDTNPPV